MKYVHKFEKNELELLFKYASKCSFIMETGGGGISTEFLSLAAEENGAIFVSIQANQPYVVYKNKNIDYSIGWSILYEDIIKPGNKYFFDVPKFNKYFEKDKDGWKGNPFLDGIIAHGHPELMKGEQDLIRKSLIKYNNILLDFFFCDTGEYCGLAEWNIVKNAIKVGGYFACHDIYYPKSIKAFRIYKKIRSSSKWEIKVKTKSKQGLLIAQRIK
jgi:hypothetical protein